MDTKLKIMLICGGKVKKYGAEGGTRTPTSYLTRPSNVRVYQFRHFGSIRKVFKNQDVAELGLTRACYFFFS